MQKAPAIIATIALSLASSAATAQMGVSLGNSGALGANGPSALGSDTVRQTGPHTRFVTEPRSGHAFHGGHARFPHHRVHDRGAFHNRSFHDRFDSGVKIRVGDRDDDFRLRARLGGSHFKNKHAFRHKGSFVRFRHGFPVILFGNAGFGSSYRYPYGYHGYDDPYYWDQPIEYQTNYQDPRLAPGYQTAPQQPQQQTGQNDERELTELERARLALSFEDTREAIAAYRAHLQGEPGDGAAMRELALALLEEGEVANGVALLRQAYEGDPELARDPIDQRVLGRDARSRLGSIVRKVSMYANKGDSSSGWLAITVLIQAEERDRVARLNLDRAIRAGLAESLARPIGLAIGYPEPELRERFESRARRSAG